jgi:mannosyl-3-phosphoglycerate phosphatase
LKTKTIIFADLDGTFLDHSYNCNKTKPIVKKLASLGGSVVFCSSKTKAEIEHYQKLAGIKEPFISENGGAIYIPKNYFPHKYECISDSQYNVIRLGPSYDYLRNKLAIIKRKTSAKIVGFGDMTLQQLIQDTKLPSKLAALAQKREHDEPFKIIEGDKAKILQAIEAQGLHCTKGGRYFHLTGDTDKGKALNVLKNLYSQIHGQVRTLAVGDGPNDLPMLRVADKPFFISKKCVNSMFNAWTGILQQCSEPIII